MSRVKSSIPLATEKPTGASWPERFGRVIAVSASIKSQPGVLVAALAVVGSLLVTMPLALHLTTSIYGYPGDATGTVSIFWWWGYALVHGKPILDNTMQGVPLGSEWSSIAFSPLPVFIFAPLSALLGPILSYNLFVLSGFPLTALATYLLARRLGISGLGSAFAGLSLAFTPYHLEKAMGHAPQTHLEFLIGVLLCLTIWRSGGRIWWVVGAGVLAGLQVWLEPSITYVMAFTIATYFVASAVVVVLKEPDKFRRLASHLVGGAVLSLVILPFLPVAAYFLHRPGKPGAGAGSLALTVRSIAEVQIYSARFREYIQPYYGNPLVPGFIKRWELGNLHLSNWTESTILLGYTVIALALVGIVTARKVFPIVVCLALIVVGAIVSHAPDGAVLGIPIHYPSYYLWHVVNSFRVYARFAWMVLLGGSLLAGMGLSVIQSQLKPGKLRWLLVIPFVLAAIEFNNVPPSHVFAILPAPAEYTWLASQPQGVLMEYPANAGNAQDQEVQSRQDLLYQMVHLHPTFLNASTTGTVATVAHALEPYYAPGVVEKLRAYGVRYVFVHASDYRADGFRVPTQVAGLAYEGEINGVAIFIVD